MKLYLTAIILFVFGYKSNSQTYTDVTAIYDIDHSFELEINGAGCSFYDFNRDGMDDITLPLANGPSKFYANHNNGQDFVEVSLGNLPDIKRNLIWVDYDNDGDSDISYAAFGGKFRLFKNLGDMTFEEVIVDLPSNHITSNYGVSWGDYNNDGLLDAYICRYPDNDYPYEAPNHNLLYKNNGNDTFTDVTFQAGVADGYQASFMATWFDFNNDGHEDIHVINDRMPFANSLYINNGDGTFINMAQELNLDIYILSMSSTVGDFDNDEDFDIFVSNGPLGNVLLRQFSNGIFLNEFPDSGVETFRGCWGGNWVDFDNNGWKDLFVCVENDKNYMYVNNNGVDFDADESIIPSEEYKSFSCAKGDLDNDGKYDLLLLNEDPGTSRILRNNHTNAGNFVKVSLEGVVSNRDAIGSKITYYINGAPHMQYTFCGTDYMSQDSQHLILGIGDAESVDSLSIKWPLGLTEWYYDIPESTHLSLLEGSTLTYNMSDSGSTLICEGELIEVDVTGDYSSIIWSNNSSNSAISIDEPGTYFATLYYNDNFYMTTDTLYVVESENPVILSLDTEPALCYGEPNGNAYLSYSYSVFDGEFNGEPVGYTSTVDLEFTGLEQGDYSELIINEEHCSFIAQFSIESPPELFTFATSTEVDCNGNDNGSVDFSSFGGVPEYDYQILGGFDQENLAPGEYLYVTTDNNGCLFQGNFSIQEPAPLSINILEIVHATDFTPGSASFEVLGGVPPYDTIWNGTHLGSSNSVINLSPGVYTLQVIDGNGCIVDTSLTIDLVVGITSLETLSLQVHPNPVQQTLHLDGLPQGDKSVRIFNSFGQLVSQLDFTNEKLNLNVSALATGAYYGFVSSKDQILRIEFYKSN